MGNYSAMEHLNWDSKAFWNTHAGTAAAVVLAGIWIYFALKGLSLKKRKH